jgi:hypothetical protein
MWVAGLVVVAGAGVLTAHGLIEVAKGSKVPDSIAWLYPVITDGLALVAYAATTRLWDRGRAYAWSVVVLAAGLSAIAQASFLATGQPQASAGLRFAVGAWPAIAAAIAAHLLFLITDAGHSHHQPLTVRERTSRAVATTATVLASSHDRLEQGVQGVQSGVQTGRSGVQVEHPEVIDLDTEPITEDHARDGSVSESVFNDERRPGARPAFSPADRAFAMAELHRSRNGVLPSVRELATLAEVSTGTAQTALRQLRQAPAPLHLVADDTNQEPSA